MRRIQFQWPAVSEALRVARSNARMSVTYINLIGDIA